MCPLTVLSGSQTPPLGRRMGIKVRCDYYVTRMAAPFLDKAKADSEFIFARFQREIVGTLVTRIVEVWRIDAVMGWKFFHEMVPLEDMVKFMDANMVLIRILVCQV